MVCGLDSGLSFAPGLGGFCDFKNKLEVLERKLKENAELLMSTSNSLMG